jgi:hypothetical protein
MATVPQRWALPWVWGPFQYLWSTGETTASITGPAGNYTVIISDAIGCENGPIDVVIGPGGSTRYGQCRCRHRGLSGAFARAAYGDRAKCVRWFMVRRFRELQRFWTERELFAHGFRNFNWQRVLGAYHLGKCMRHWHGYRTRGPAYEFQ